jgi:hypothetical protein
MIVNEEILKTVISAIKELKHDDIEKGELKWKKLIGLN